MPRTRRKDATPEERAKWAANRAQHVADLKSEFDDAVSQLVTSEGWAAVLESVARFRHRSFRNMILILRKCPHATHVEGYTQWQRQGRQVRRGEDPIYILAPMPIRAKDAEGDDAGEPESDGKRARPRTFFKPVRVYDISQTDRIDGQPDPEPVNAAPRLTGEVPPGMWASLADYVAAQGYTVERGDTAPANGWTRPEGRIVRVSDTLPDAHAAKTLCHEAAHITCDHVADMDEYRQHRGRMETEAESVAYVVCRALGMDSATVSVPYVAGWAGDTPEAVRDTIKATGQQVMAAAQKILDAVAPDREHGAA
ncbi:ArdC-like ssDNA-binding domain-containing protein [Streptomyces sp. NPDC059718]